MPETANGERLYIWLGNADRARVEAALLRCCSCQQWVSQVLQAVPFEDHGALLHHASEVWYSLSEAAWLEAFAGHPRIGDDIEALRKKYGSTAEWALGEQSGVSTATEATLRGLVEANDAYAERFGFIFIVCASGKGAEEMLRLLISRIENERDDEIRIAAVEQMKITRLRLVKLDRTLSSTATGTEDP